jgi:hypothetical protein
LLAIPPRAEARLSSITNKVCEISRLQRRLPYTDQGFTSTSSFFFKSSICPLIVGFVAHPPLRVQVRVSRVRSLGWVGLPVLAEVDMGLGRADAHEWLPLRGNYEHEVEGDAAIDRDRYTRISIPLVPVGLSPGRVPYSITAKK